MNKNRIILLIFLGLTIHLEAQNLKKNLKLQVSEVADVNGKRSYLSVIEGKDGSFYAIDLLPKGFKKGFRIIEFDINMKEIKRSDILLEREKEKLSFEDIYYNENKLTLLTSSFYQKGDKMKIFVQNIDLKTLKPNSKHKLLTDFVPQKKKVGKYGLYTLFSRDESKFLVFRYESEGKKEKSRYIMSVFDADDNFQKLWSNKIESNGIDNLEDIENIKLNNDGTLYLMVKKFANKRKPVVDGKPNYKFKLHEYSNNGNTKNEIDIDLKDEFITQITIGINQNDDIVCTGFYSSMTSDGLKGCFYILMDSRSKKIVKESRKEFSLDFITSDMSVKRAKKLIRKKAKGKEIELPYFDLSDIVLDDLGGVIQVAERYYVTSTTFTDANGNTSTTYTYHFDDLIVISISPDGNIDWARKIQKAQAVGSPRSSFVSYHLSVIGEKLYFFYNGNAENLVEDGKKRTKGWATGKSATGIITEINSEGYMRSDIFYDYPGHQAFVLIRNTTDFENEIMFMSNFRKKVKFLKLEILD